MMVSPGTGFGSGYAQGLGGAAYEDFRGDRSSAHVVEDEILQRCIQDAYGHAIDHEHTIANAEQSPTA